MIERIEHRGVLIGECSLPGETRAEGVVPAHPNGIQVSRDRWLVIYATRRFCGVDDDLSIVYQLRAGGPDGAVLREGMLARSHDDWDALGDGNHYVRQHGHPVAFGVPRGARIGGYPAPHANLFVAKWRRVARAMDRETGKVRHSREEATLRQRTQDVEWVQFRLNNQEDDIEIVQTARPLRQKGYEDGPAICAAPVAHMNQSFTQAVPFTPDATVWADCNHFDGGRIAALKYVFNPVDGIYEWTETGPFFAEPEATLHEASLAQVDGAWIIAARTEGGRGAAWARTPDPFEYVMAPVYQSDPICRGPLTVFRCGDGVLRMFGGDAQQSPYGRGRDPLFCWDIDPETFVASNRQVIFDSVKAGLPFRREAIPVVDMCKLLPNQGSRQLAVHRVRVRAIEFPYIDVTITPEERLFAPFITPNSPMAGRHARTRGTSARPRNN